MNIQKTIIAVFICFLVNLNVAEAIPTQGSGQQPGWQKTWHHKWNNFRHRKWRLKWRHSLKAPKFFNSPSTGAGASFAGMHHDVQKYFNGQKSPFSSHPTRGGNGNHHGSGNHVKAPEISVASGTSAIALLTGMLLLTGERTRSRKIKA